MTNKTPELIVVMGVSGCGKSTLAQTLAVHKRYEFIEADDYHSEEAVAMMSAGVPLTDAVRQPWIQRLSRALLQKAAAGTSVVMAFSGLRQNHRQTIRALPFKVSYLWLKGSQAHVSAQMQRRAAHFFSPGLLASQYQALESPEGEEDVSILELDNQPDLNQLLKQSEEMLYGQC